MADCGLFHHHHHVTHSSHSINAIAHMADCGLFVQAAAFVGGRVE
jgi:hypothetical protein